MSASAFLLLVVATGVASSGVVGCKDGPCVTLPQHSASDLACDTDEDCTVTWSGTVCCGCYCGDAPANTAAQARDQDAIDSQLSGSSCSKPACSCPATYRSLCVAGQCTLCTLPNFSSQAGQPPACEEDAGPPDASGAPDASDASDAAGGE